MFRQNEAPEKTRGVICGVIAYFGQIECGDKSNFLKEVGFVFYGVQNVNPQFFLLCSLKNGDCELTNAKNNCRIDITKDAQSMG